MKISIKQAEELSNSVLQNLGFCKKDVFLITRNLIEAELAERKSHGLVRLPAIKRLLSSNKISATHENIDYLEEESHKLYIDAKNKPGIIPLYASLDKSVKLVKQSDIVFVGIKNAAYCSGYIGSYAREATKHDCIFIGFNNSPGALIPYGAKEPLWGTNPLTVGIPSSDKPIILDMATSKITWGDILVANSQGTTLPKDSTLDKEGKKTTKPKEAMGGGILPIAGYKGSGLAFIIELLAGVLTGSRVGFSVKGGWGSSYILLNPAIFRDMDRVKADIDASIKELKEASKAKGVDKIRFPGENSYDIYERNFKKGNFKIDEKLYNEIKKLVS